VSAPEPLLEGPTQLLYLSERLSVGRADTRHWDELALKGPVVGTSSVAWDVYRGNGAISAPTFADLIGDEALTAVLSNEWRKAHRKTNALVLGGVALAVLAVIPIVSLEDPNALTQGRWTVPDGAVRSLEGRNENRWYAAGSIFGTGLLTISAAPFLSASVHRRQQSVANYYSQQEAEDRIDPWNSHLRALLGYPDATTPAPTSDAAPAEPAAAPTP
jgi:hypothetical protein